MKQVHTLVLYLLALITLSACAGSAGVTGSPDSRQNGDILGTGEGQNTSSSYDVNAQNMAIGDSISFPFDSSNNATLTFNPDDNGDYILSVYTIDTDNNNNSFTFSLDGNSSNHSLIEGSNPNNRLSERESHQDDLGFEAMLRHDESELAQTEPIPQKSLNANERSARVDNVSLGDTREFCVLDDINSNSSCTTVVGEAALIMSNLIVYTDPSCPLEDNEVENYQELDDLSEMLKTMTGGWSDIDNNGKFIILPTCVVNGLGALSQGFVTGFFYARDLYCNTENSNCGEVLYVNIPDPDADYGSAAISHEFWRENFQKIVAQHELQHLISYNRHVLENGSQSEDSFFNESISHLVEDLTLDGSDSVSAENPSRGARYLGAISTTSLFAGTNIAQRGGGYLFLRYLYEQANLGNIPGVTDGRDLISKLIDSDEHGVDNIESVTGVNIDDLLGRFFLTLAVSNRELTDSDLFNFVGFDLYRERFSNNRGTTFSGPAIELFDTSDFEIGSNTATYISISAEDIAASGGLITINGGTGNPRAHLIKLN